MVNNNSLHSNVGQDESNANYLFYTVGFVV